DGGARAALARRRRGGAGGVRLRARERGEERVPVRRPPLCDQPAARLHHRPGDIVTIAGHANGWPRVVSTSKVKEVDEHYLYYGANTLDGSSGSPVLVLREGGACVVAGLHQGRSAEAGANYGLRLGPALADAVRRARRASSQAADGAPAAAGHGGGDALCSSAGATGHHPDVHIVRRRG
ncbi:unnamed protein product, partial [Prorocentrum cordatum]